MQVQSLKQVVPRLTSVAVLPNPATPLHGRDVKELEAGARPLRVRLEVVDARAPNDIE